MKSYERFVNFLQLLRGNGDDVLIESIGEGFKVCFEGESLPVISDMKLKTLVYKISEKYTYNKMYTDNSWFPVREMVDEINTAIPIFNMIKSEYDTNSPHKSKRWIYEGDFRDPKGRTRRVMAVVTASGGGSVEDPLDRYDLNITLHIGAAT